MEPLSEEFDAAMAWASRRHAGQRRHNTGAPYISHLLATCAIVLEEGGDEDMAIAALLHDVLEDGPTARAELRERFNAEVYRLVDACTDADLAERAGLSWRDRKLSHLRRMAELDDRALLIIAADKVNSLQAIMDDFVRFGPELFDRSVRSSADLLWNYRQVVAVIAARLGERPVARRLSGLVTEFATRAGGLGPRA
jgi:(p)ppGpp synthase/HD superfamily hydrolase